MSDFGVPASASNGPQSGPQTLTADEFENILDDLVNSLEDGLQIVTANQGSLSASDKQLLDARLDSAEALIDQVFNPAQAPNLTPTDAGTVSLSFSPVTLMDYAEECADLAHQAQDELLLHGNQSSDVLIGTRLKTIRYLISRSSPHNYRSKAGIN